MSLPYEAPPDYGMIQFEVPAAPVSFQAPGTKKAGIVSAVRALVSPCEYLLSGDVKLTIRWQISERARYEADSSADVDNIIKPILDALCGPDGIMIDDCQVQELTCYWTGGRAKPDEERIEIELKFDPDAYLAKTGLLFLNVDRGLYFPVHDDLPPDLVLELAERLLDRFRSVSELVAKGFDAESAHSMMPIQRVFHKSRLGLFRMTTIEDLRRRFG